MAQINKDTLKIGVTFTPCDRCERVEVVHGRWINIKEYGNFCVGFCSVCAAEQKETSVTALRAFHRHCRWCGARMDKERGDEQ